MPKKWYEFWKTQDEIPEINSSDVPAVTTDQSHEFNTRIGMAVLNYVFDCPESPHSSAEIRKFLSNPFAHITELRRAARWAYRTNGVVSTGIDFMRSIYTLDGVVVTKAKRDGKVPHNFRKNRAKMSATLRTIRYKQIIRDAIFCDANDGMYAAYFETKLENSRYKEALTDYEIHSIVEISELGINAMVIPLPIDYVRIIGRRNNTYQIAFDLRYFDDLSDEAQKRRLAGMPQEIQDGWKRRVAGTLNGDWLVLDQNKTIVTKIKSKISDPYGIPFAIAALDDINYAKYFIDTKRNVLDSVNHQIVYETFPEGKDKGTSALSEKQQREQHDLVKNALASRKSNTSGTSFFSLASGTRLDKITLDVSLLDEKNESSIKDVVNKDLGLSASALDGSANGNYSSANLNLELVAANIYTWIEDIVAELNKCINRCVISDDSCVVELYILPITLINREKMVENMNSLYAQGKGSLIAWVASTGIDPENYIALMEYELEEDYENRYPVHRTSYTASDKGEPGRPKTDSNDPASIQQQTNGANSAPSPSG